jgi:hypothetical protein
VVIVQDRVAQRIRRLFPIPGESDLLSIYEDKTDLPKLHRRVDEVVLRFQVRARLAYIKVLDADCCQVTALMRQNAVFARVNTHIGHTTQHRQSGGEDIRLDVDNGTPLINDLMCTCSNGLAALLYTLSPLHSARWNALDEHMSLEQEPATALATILSWAQSPSGKSVFWLSDEAGTMSSTLARHFCRHVADLHLLGASFFVTSQSQPPHEPLKVIHSIVYQLAVHKEAFSRAICAALRQNPDLLTRRLQDQCQHLIVEPARTIPAESPLFIVIDAFDMCSLDAQARGGSELFRALFDAVSQSRGQYRVLFTSHISDKTRRLHDDLDVSQNLSLFQMHTMKSAAALDVSHLVVSEGKRDIGLSAHDCVLTEHLIPRLEALLRNGVDALVALDILDRVRP